MNILYYSYLTGDAFSEQLKGLRYYPQMISLLSSQRELVAGLDKNGAELILGVYVPYQRRELKKTLFRLKPDLYDAKHQVGYLSYVNLPIMQELSLIVSSIVNTRRWIRKTKGVKDRAVLLDLNNLIPVVLGTMIVCKLKKIHLCARINDANIDIFNQEAIGQFSASKRFLISAYLKVAARIEQHFDSYIYVAPGMNESINKKNKPHITIEGFFNSKSKHVAPRPKQNAILYAGGLHRKYGVGKLLEVFAKIEEPTLQLWICGAGEMEQEIEAAAKQDARIKFLGFIPQEEVLERAAAAKLLINLRDPTMEYTARSFPGKIFDYMASGTPLFSTKIKGIPDSYYRHIFHGTGYDTEKLAVAVASALNKSDDELDAFGADARSFLEQHAEGVVQAKKILNFLKR